MCVRDTSSREPPVTYCVRSVHSSAGTWARTRVLQNLHAFLFRDLVVNVLSVGLEGADNVQRFVRRGHSSGSDSSTVDHDSRTIETSHGHDTSRHVLVAPGQGNQAVVPLASHGSFNGIGNQVPTLQRKAHTRSTHTDSVRYSDRIESVSDELVGSFDAVLDSLGKIKEMHVTGVSFVPNRANPNLRFVHVFFRQSSRVQHGLRSPLYLGLCQGSTTRIQKACVSKDSQQRSCTGTNIWSLTAWHTTLVVPTTLHTSR